LIVAGSQLVANHCFPASKNRSGAVGVVLLPDETLGSPHRSEGDLKIAIRLQGSFASKLAPTVTEDFAHAC
jgi:hypothetical protein